MCGDRQKVPFNQFPQQPRGRQDCDLGTSTSGSGGGEPTFKFWSKRAEFMGRAWGRSPETGLCCVALELSLLAMRASPPEFMLCASVHGAECEGSNRRDEVVLSGVYTTPRKPTPERRKMPAMTTALARITAPCLGD